MININSKLPNVGTTIFTVMSQLAKKHNAINLSQGFPNYDISERLKKLAKENIAAGFNQYAPMPGDADLREALANKLTVSSGASVNKDTEITITAGATQAIYTAVSAFIQPGDEVILIEPAYDCYAPSVNINGGTVVTYSLEHPTYEIDWNDFEKLITPATKMIMINSPHNPTGSILRKSDLLALEKIVADTDIIVLSDEVYEHLIYDGEVHESVLKYPKLRERSLVTYSFGKTFHGTGWKLGYCVAPEYLMKEFRKVHQFNVFCVNHPLQKALAGFLKDPQEYLQLPEFYQKKRDYLQNILTGTGFKPIKCSGTYFQLYDYSQLSDEDDLTFAKRITKDYGVATIPVSPFYGNGTNGKVVRFCFAKTEDLLEKAGERLQKIERH